MSDLQIFALLAIIVTFQLTIIVILAIIFGKDKLATIALAGLTKLSGKLIPSAKPKDDDE